MEVSAQPRGKRITKMMLMSGGEKSLTALALLPFRLNPLVYCTAVILSGAPVAGSTGIFAQKFGRDPTASAQFVTLSTLLSILTLPVITVLAQYLAG